MNEKRKILIVGEASGFSRDLKKGLEIFGVQVSVFSIDDWYKIHPKEQDIQISIKNYRIRNREIPHSWRIRSAFQCLPFFQWKKTHQHYFDTILVINIAQLTVHAIDRIALFTINDLKQLLKPEGKIFLNSLGDDYPYLTESGDMRFWFYSHGVPIPRHRFKKGTIKLHSQILDQLAGIIPTMYCYAEPWRRYTKKHSNINIYPTIPLPFDHSCIPFYENIVHEKIVIYHGKNRDDAKGSRFIIQAMQRIKQMYPNRVEIIISERMPYDQYIETVKHCNIMIDQCKSYCYGMATLLSMAQGRVVFSGNEPEAAKELSLNEIPIVPISPDIEDMVRKLEYFVLHPEQIKQWSVRSRTFVENSHDYHKIAKKYLELFYGQTIQKTNI